MSTEVKWNSDQVRLSLTAVLRRLQKDIKSFKVTQASYEVKIENRDLNNWVTLHITKSSGRIFMVIGEYAGHYEPQWFPWNDKEIKALSAALISLKNTVEPNMVDMELHKHFPEIPTLEFENQVLLKK